MLGWSSEAGNPNIQDLKEKLATAEREKPPGDVGWERIDIQPAGAVEKTVRDRREELFSRLQADFSAATESATILTTWYQTWVILSTCPIMRADMV